MFLFKANNDTIKVFNVALMSISFCFIFIGFATLSGLQTLIFASAQNKDNTDGYVEGFHVEGLTSLSILFGVFTFCNLFAPSVIVLLGPRLTMVAGGLIYILYISQLFFLNDYMMYSLSALLGFGSAIIWTAQGNFLTLNSDSETMSRNSGIFWAIMKSGTFFGNIFAYFLFRGKEDISSGLRHMLGYILLGSSSLGVGLLVFLQPTPWVTNSSLHKYTVVQAFRDIIKLLFTPNMAMLSTLFMYIGALQILQGAVYSTAIGFNYQFGEERKGFASLNGIFVAIGEIIGGTVLGIFGHFTTKRGGSLYTILGLVLSAVGYVIIHVSFPYNATMGETGPQDLTVIDSNVYLALTTSTLLGLSDSCFVTQIFSLLGRVYSDNSRSAFAIMKFIQSASAALAYFYSPILGLHNQLYLAFSLAFLGTIGYCYVEYKEIRKRPEEETNETKEGQDSFK